MAKRGPRVPDDPDERRSVPIFMRVTPKLHNALARSAARNGRRITQQIEWLVGQALVAEEEPHRGHSNAARRSRRHGEGARQ